MNTAGWQCYLTADQPYQSYMYGLIGHSLVLFQIMAPIQGNREWICACKYRWCM